VSPLGTLDAAELLVLSFAGLIAAGTVGLLVMPGLYTGPELGFVDALFTATSAVCVTGLIVVDTATHFTPWGQAWIALLIQLGGLGILTFTTLVIQLLGRRASLQAGEAAGGEASIVRHLDPFRLVRAVVAGALVLEAIGAAVLWWGWSGEMGAVGALWPAVFHAISAFCNAGFSVFSDSLMGYRESPLPVLTVSGLIIVGGIGFVVLADLRAWSLREDVRRLSTHTQLVLWVTGALLFGGTGLYLAFEWSNTLSDMSLLDRLVNAWYMSVTPRTAGFNTVDYSRVTNPSLFLTIVFMVIGGSPGSAAGGLKTTTVALLGLVLWSRLRGREHVSVFGRTIPEETIQRAAGLTIGGIAILAAGVFALALTEFPARGLAERTPFLSVIFEAHSAFGTVGLSTGATPDLTTGGRLVVTALMFLGRLGPLAVVTAMAAGGSGRPRYRYANEDVAIG
jgi:trk system potassium uptake protein TrkH